MNSFIAAAFIDGEYYDDMEVYFDSNETVREVKLRFQELKGLQVLRMTHRCNKMDDDFIINEYCPQIVDFDKIPKFKIFCSLLESHFQMFVKLPTGKTATFFMSWYNTVEDLQLALQEKSGIPPDQQRLIFSGEVISRNPAFTYLLDLKKRNFTENSTVRLVLRLRGGGPLHFADVSNPDSLEIHNWSKSAPKWRVACEGMNLEGICKNQSCAAFGKKVISQQEFCSLDICGRACKCPMCNQLFQPKTCAFTSCDWMYEGVKSDGSEVKGPWKQAGDLYERFREADNMVKWDHLTISTRPKNSVRGRKSPEPVRQEPRVNGHNHFERNQRIYDEERRESKHFQAEVDRLIKHAENCDLDRKSCAADLCRDLSDLISKRLPAIQAEAGDRCFIRVNEGRVVLEFDFHSLHLKEAVQKTEVVLSAAKIIGSISSPAGEHTAEVMPRSGQLSCLF